jgi:hypothetical protein
MKKNKRRIKTFKNWLLARDSASRVSTKPTYIGFFSESLSNSLEDKNAIMNLFDAITGSNEFYKLMNFSGSNIGINKSPLGKKCYMEVGSVLLFPNISKFIIFLDPTTGDSFHAGNRRIIIEATNDVYSFSDSYAPEIKIEVPLEYVEDPKKIREIIKGIIKLIFKDLVEEGTYKERFFNWWIERLMKVGKWDVSTLSFENAFVDWLKEADSEDTKQAYVDFFSDKEVKIDRMKKSKYYRDYDSIVKEVKGLIKDANIDLGGVDRGSSLLSRFDS